MICLAGVSPRLAGGRKNRPPVGRTLSEGESAMPSPTFLRTVQVETRFSLFGQQVENVYHVQLPAAPSLSDLEQVADVFHTWAAGDLMGSLSSDLLLREIFVKDVSVADGEEFTLAITPPAAGGASGGSMPGNVAFCFSLRTSASGRRHRGRKYLPGIPRNGVSGDQLSNDFLTDLLTSMNNLITLLGEINALLVVASRVADAVSAVIAITAVDNNLDSQRRRLTGRGT